jgi:hypothetical protein
MVEMCLFHFIVSFFRSKNEAELKLIEDKIEDAAKNAGDTEVIDCYIYRITHLSRIL